MFHDRAQKSQGVRLVVAVVLTGMCCLLVARPSPGAEKPRLRFVQLNDVHLNSDPLSNRKMDYVIDSLNAGTEFPVPDFVLGVGDIVEGGSLSRRTADLALLKTLVPDLKCPFYPVMGNHENHQAEGNEAQEAPYRATFGADRVNYTFQAAGIQFVVLNNSGAPSANKTAVGAARRAWLKKVLEASPDTPKIIACHIPLVPVRDETVLRKSFGWGSYAAKDAALLQLVEDHADAVLAVLSGHVHLTGVVRHKGVYHIATSGTDNYPCDYACYEVFADRISVRMYSLPRELRAPSKSLHSRTGIAYTDATHPTHESYVSGNASERAFDIPIGRSRGKALVP